MNIAKMDNDKQFREDAKLFLTNYKTHLIYFELNHIKESNPDLYSCDHYLICILNTLPTSGVFLACCICMKPIFKGFFIIDKKTIFSDHVIKYSYCQECANISLK